MTRDDDTTDATDATVPTDLTAPTDDGDGSAGVTPAERYPTDSVDRGERGVTDDDTTGAGEVPTTDAAIRAAFDDAGIPAVETPPGSDAREVAHVRWPAAVIGETTPDVHHQADVSVTITVPPWALAVAADRLEAAADGGKVADPTDARGYIRDYLADCLHLDVSWRTPAGADAVDAVLEALDVDALRTDG
jgi:hypothetical protein